MSKFNPSDPLTIGLEWRARDTVDDPVDFGRELGIRVTPTSTWVVTGASFAETGPPTSGGDTYFSTWHLATIYRDGQERAYGEVRTTTKMVNAASTVGGTLGGGASNALDAVQDPTDGKYVLIDSTDTIDLNFAQPVWATNLPRILDVTFDLVMSTTATGASSVTLSWQPTANVFGTIVVAPNAPSQGDTYSVDTGEIFLGGYDYTPGPDNRRRPWVKGDFVVIENGTVDLRITNTTGSTRVHYASMTVTYCEENRVGVGGYWESTTPTAFTDPATLPWRPVMQIVDPQNVVATGGVTLSQDTPYIVSFTRANDVNVDGLSRPSNGNDQWYQFGEPRLIAGILYTDPRIVRGVSARRLSNGLLSADFADVDRTYAISLHGPAGNPTPTYNGIINDLTQPYMSARGSANSQFSQRLSSSQSAIFYSMRVVVRRFGSPGNQTFTFFGGGGGSAVLTNAMYDAAEKDAEGWAEVRIPIAGGASFAAGVPRDVFTSTGTGASRWETMALTPIYDGSGLLFETATYGGTTLFGNASVRVDIPMTLHTMVPPVTGLAVTRGHEQLLPLSSACASPVLRAFDYVNVSWGAIPIVTGTPATGGPITGSVLTSEFNAWQVDRLDKVDPVWRRVANIYDRGHTWFADYEARVGVYSDYRVRMCRDDGEVGAWTKTGMLSFSGAAGAYVSVPDSAQFATPGDYSLAVRIKPQDWTPGATQTLFSHFVAGAGQRGWVFQLETTGRLGFVYSTNGTATSSTTSPLLSTLAVVDGQTWLWCGLDFKLNANGAISEIRFWTAPDADVPAWELLGSTLGSASAPTFTPTVATPLTLGAQGDGSARYTGQMSDAVLYFGHGDVEVTGTTAVPPLGGPGGRPLFVFNGQADLLGPSSAITSFETTSRHVATLAGAGATAAVSGFMRLGGSISPTAPLVTGTGCEALLLTSNEDPANTVAAPMLFQSGTPIEPFAFGGPETVVFQRLHGRDYVAGFKPVERGGVRFQRTLLLNALSVPPIRLDAFFATLRDLTWEQLAYVCVLDPRGGRWFATVLVPDGTVREINQVYMGSIDVVQTTDEPYPVEVY